MNTNGTKRGIRLAALGGTCVFGAMLSILVGCGPGLPIRGGTVSDGSAVEPGTGQVGRVKILNILNDIGFSSDVILAIRYTTPDDATDIVAFYQTLTAPASAGGSPTGIEEVIGENLSAGAEQAFSFNTADLRPSFYQLGIRAGGETGLSGGTIEIQGPPSPLFVRPSEDTPVPAGTPLEIVGDIGDPQGKAQWRLFFQGVDEEQVNEGESPDGGLVGTQLTVGLGNSATFTWNTTNVPLGEYVLGLSATDEGLSIAAAVDSDRDIQIFTRYSDFVVEIRPADQNALIPTIAFDTKDLTAFAGETVDIEFKARTFEGDEFTVEVSSIFDDKTTLIGDPVTDSTVSIVSFDTSGLESGDYIITATISDGINPLIETDEEDRIVVQVVQTGDALVTLEQPEAGRQIAQDEDLLIQWSTNVPIGTDRVVRVSAQPLTVGGANNGAEIEIAADLALAQSSVIWNTGTELGRLIIEVELSAPELTTDLKDSSEIRVARAPMIVWAGSIGLGADSTRAGEVYEGVNFKDAAGTVITGVGDYDGDGKDEFIIVSRFGKPFFLNAGGTGAGEGYMIYGGQRQNLTRSLNSVGTTVLRGLTFAGIQPADAFQDRTNGLSAVRLISDQDADGLPEIAFGFPFTTSRGFSWRLRVAGLQGPAGPFDSSGALERARQFERGGIVILSSKNTPLADPPDSSNPDLPFEDRSVINLDLVGQRFENVELELFPNDPDVPLGCNGLYVTDQYAAVSVDFPDGCSEADDCIDPDDLLAPTNCPNDTDGDGTDEDCCCVPVDVCARGDSDDCFETFFARTDGFGLPLADHLGTTCRPFTRPPPASGPACSCFNASADGQDPPIVGFDGTLCGAPVIGENGDPCLFGSDQLLEGIGSCGAHGRAGAGRMLPLSGAQLDSADPEFIELPNNLTLGSGYYPLVEEPQSTGIACEEDEDCPPCNTCEDNFCEDPFNQPLEPFGARIIGNSPNMDLAQGNGFSGDLFGSSIAVTGGMLIVSAPDRIPLLEVDIFPPMTPEPGNTRGVMYLMDIDNWWPEPEDGSWDCPDDDDVSDPSGPPLPFQYQVGPFPAPSEAVATDPNTPPTPTTRNWPSHCGRNSPVNARPASFPHRILGDIAQQINVVEGVPDFNLDGREDFVVGAPAANGGAGEVNIAFRRDPFLEGDYLLGRLAEAPTSPTRLAGLFITGRAGEGFGQVIARSLAAVDDSGIVVNETIDFNGDGKQDIILGNPGADCDAGADCGEVIIIFATRDLVSPLGGFSIDDLLAEKDASGDPRAVRIRGADAGDRFGFNVAIAGDFDGDGKNDLLIAAPGASPMFDSNADGVLDTAGIDIFNLEDPESMFGDGVADDVDGDGTADLLTDAGQVYLILGLNNLKDLADDTSTIEIDSMGTSGFRGLIFVGRTGSDSPNSTNGDQLGGGEGSRTIGGVATQFRSFGVGAVGDVDGDGRDDIALGSILANPRHQTEAGEVYLFYGFTP